MSREGEGLAEVAARRRAVEQRLSAVRAALASETGWAPQRRGLLIGLIAGTVGLAITLRRRAARRRDGELPRPARGDE